MKILKVMDCCYLIFGVIFPNSVYKSQVHAGRWKEQQSYVALVPWFRISWPSYWSQERLFLRLCGHRGVVSKPIIPEMLFHC